MSKDLFGYLAKPPLKNRAKGNAAPIGSGPEGETCKSCKYATGYKSWNKRIYYKCDLVKKTNGIGTDIRLKWAACSRWEDEYDS